MSSKLVGRIKLHKDSNSFTHAKEMTRHEIEIEQSLYRGTKIADDLKHLIKAKHHGIFSFHCTSVKNPFLFKISD